MYKEAAVNPQKGLCCTTIPVWQLPGLNIPHKMLEMNYGCGSTVHPRDLINNPKILYVGVGSGMELLQFSYFSRRKGGVVGVDGVENMLEAAEQKFNLEKDIFIESVEICAIKDPIPDDGPCIFTGRTAIYFGSEEYYDDNTGHVLTYNQPLAVCDKTALKLSSLEREDIFISKPIYFYDGGGFC